MATTTMPDLRFLAPGWNENRWSDLLATLVLTDPHALARFIGGAMVDGVRREVSVAGAAVRAERLDLLLMAAASPRPRSRGEGPVGSRPPPGVR